jgi:hypothetical protein
MRGRKNERLVSNACDYGVAARDADFKKRMARNSHASHCSTAFRSTDGKR